MVMAMEDTTELLKEQPNLEAYIIFLDDKRETQEFMTDGFKRLIVNN